MQSPQEIPYINKQKKAHDDLTVHQNEPWKVWNVLCGTMLA